MTESKTLRVLLIAICVLILISAFIVTYILLSNALRDIVELRAVTVELGRKIDTLKTDDAIGGTEEVYTDPATTGEIQMPVAEDDFLMLTSPYGHRVSPFFGIDVQHTGLDIATVWQAQVTSVADGVVVEHWPAPGVPVPDRRGVYFQGHPVYGGMVVIEHDDGFKSLYAHMESTRVYTGKRVAAGHVIGRVGDTGMARGRHLHFELSVDGRHVNPLLYLPEAMRDVAMEGR